MIPVQNPFPASGKIFLIRTRLGLVTAAGEMDEKMDAISDDQSPVLA